MGTILWVGLACVSCYEWKDGRRRRKRKRGKWKEMRGREGGRNREKIDGAFGNIMESLDSFSDSFQ